MPFACADPMHALNRIFQRIYVLNIDSATERMEHMRNELRGVEFRRFSAITPEDGRFSVPERLHVKPGALACTLSHMAILEEARRDRLANVLIFEDDVMFDRDFLAYDPALIERFITANDWALFYLGGLHVEPPVRVAPGIVRVSRELASYAYAVNGRYLDTVLASIDAMKFKLPIDVNFAYFVNPRAPCFCTFPRLFIHPGGHFSYVHRTKTDLAIYCKDVIRDGAVRGRLFPLTVENVPWGRFLPR